MVYDQNIENNEKAHMLLYTKDIEMPWSTNGQYLIFNAEFAEFGHWRSRPTYKQNSLFWRPELLLQTTELANQIPIETVIEFAQTTADN